LRFLNFQMAFVFSQVAFLVGHVQRTPLVCRLVHSVGEALKHGVAVFTSVAMPSQCG
jgi:uncharacterized membrane protein YhhN